MNPGDLIAWHTWNCFHQSQTTYARRYTRAGGTGAMAQQFSILAKAWAALGDNFAWHNVKFRAVGRVLHWQSREGEWIPITAELGGNCQR